MTRTGSGTDSGTKIMSIELHPWKRSFWLGGAEEAFFRPGEEASLEVPLEAPSEADLAGAKASLEGERLMTTAALVFSSVTLVLALSSGE